MKTPVLLAILLSTILGPATAFAAPSAPRATTQAGRIEGVSRGHLNIYRGIPYAAPPVGPLRWRAPQPVQPWTGVRASKTFGAACLQKEARKDPERSLKDVLQSEDCLTLNIWAPAAHSAHPRPVMVWVHGGSFRFGSGQLSTYDGSALARKGVIVVTLNYRLGVFGTFAHPAVQTPGEPGGNYGLLDVIAALKWVRANIGAFGGNRDAVTLFGESAGGVSVGYLMASPLAKGLFERAIIESGGLKLPEYDKGKAETIARKIATTLKADDAASLRALPATALRDVETAAADTMPYLDGTVVPDRLRDAFAQGKEAPVAMIIGSNSAEAGFFGPRYWKDLPQEVPPQTWKTLTRQCFDYGKSSADACTEQIASENFAGVTTRAMARSHAHRAAVWVYRFDWVPPAQRKTTRGAIHTAEIPYVFGHVAENSKADRASQRLSRELMDRWVAFAKNGIPVFRKGDWPRFRPLETHKTTTRLSERILLIGSRGTTISHNPADALLDAIDAANLAARP